MNIPRFQENIPCLRGVDTEVPLVWPGIHNWFALSREPR